MSELDLDSSMNHDEEGDSGQGGDDFDLDSASDEDDAGVIVPDTVALAVCAPPPFLLDVAPMNCYIQRPDLSRLPRTKTNKKKRAIFNPKEILQNPRGESSPSMAVRHQALVHRRTRTRACICRRIIRMTSRTQSDTCSSKIWSGPSGRRKDVRSEHRRLFHVRPTTGASWHNFNGVRGGCKRQKQICYVVCHNAECKIDENFTIHINFTIQVQFTKQGFMKGVIGQRWSERECVFRML